ncbi:MAG: membrane dipeptidase [Clostridia bacterium]|nr:membrane dipeptidase [Clostridia bacterium]
MWIADGHCDSILCLATGAPLVGVHNFSAKYPQLQMTAVFAEDRARFDTLFRDFHAALAQESKRIVQVRTAREITRTLGAGKHAALLTVEGGAGITTPETVREMYGFGVRVLGLAWHSNALAVSSRHQAEGIPDTGLTPLGRAAVRAGNACGMIFDVSHLSDASFWQLLETAKTPPVATHSCMRALCAHPRNLTDEMARALVARGGMIGVNLYPPFLTKNGENCTVSHYFAHIEHALGLLGEDAVGFGGDIDGTDRVYPAPLDESCSIHDTLIEEMARRNYPACLIAKLAGENWLRYLQKNLPD